MSLGGWLLLAMTSALGRIASRAWVKMPALESMTAAAHPKYVFKGNALVIYRGESAYVAFDDETDRDELAHHSDVHVLTDSEGREFEESLPFPVSPPTPRRNRVIGLGDVISWLTRRIGIAECSGCGARRGRLNKIVLWGWAKPKP